MDCPILLQFG